MEAVQASYLLQSRAGNFARNSVLKGFAMLIKFLQLYLLALNKIRASLRRWAQLLGPIQAWLWTSLALNNEFPQHNIRNILLFLHKRKLIQDCQGSDTVLVQITYRLRDDRRATKNQQMSLPKELIPLNTQANWVSVITQTGTMLEGRQVSARTLDEFHTKFPELWLPFTSDDAQPVPGLVLVTYPTQMGFYWLCFPGKHGRERSWWVWKMQETSWL